ncbi:dnaJ homolog subfamily C member 16-like [Mya arenaria]|uniref:dnaJ homolog subfamily C member 16-like n=1 Tax=Mya arenaria TaxID=6604 RepID=UPI0022E32702|nr:dnaJ homolog subfamily C member 16-like [Mya arenaria]
MLIRIKLNYLIALFAICCLYFDGTKANNRELYDVLGVRQTATQKDIKRAYKNLARQWHPDKTDDPDATSKFTKINEAYETLGDPDKRHEYDNFGYTSANARQPNRPQQGFHGSPFDSFFPGGNGGFRFNFNNFGGDAESTIERFSINLRQYETTILPNSVTKPCIIYAYADFCFNCMRIEGILEKFFSELKAVGLCAASFHAGRSGGLSSALRVSTVPSIVGVVNERLFYFKGSVSIQSLHEFTRGLFPNNFVTKVFDSNVEPFLSGWPADNKVRGLFFSPREDLSARFLAPAYFYRENVAFGHIYTQSLQGKDMLRKFGVNKHRETLLLFNEDTSSPVATISMQQLSRSTLDEVIEGNKYLTLPRLSSQKLFEELCPDGYKVKNRKLCVVLITKKGPAQDGTREQFRQYSQASKLNGNERVRFTYMFEDTQADFVNTLMMKGKQKEADEALKVAILWRVEKYQLKYEWLETGWQAEQRARCSKALDSRLNVLLTTDTVMPYNIVPPELFNEHGLNLLTRIGLKLLSWAEKIAGLLNMLDSTTWITLLLTVLFVGGMGYFMHKLASLEEIQVQQTLPRKTRPRPPSRTFDAKNLNLYELDYRMYQELVTEADTGLTVVILVDKDSKDTLVKEFAKIVHPYSRYSALTFAFLQLEYNLKWYKSLLQLSVDDFKLDGINIKNCIGTVLAINGFRKYYYIYSAKNGRKYIRKRNNVSEALGLDEADEKSDEEENFFYLDEILDGLALWMDKIFDGSIKRIRITQWPELADKL